MSRPAWQVAVIVAATDQRPIRQVSMLRCLDEVRGRGVVVLVDGTARGIPSATLPDRPELLLIRGAPRALAPELWRDGLRATNAPRVVFTTTAMEPARGWLDALLACAESTGAAGVGGPIVPVDGLSATDRAVYLLRYLRYSPPLPATGVEPPGDNAFYRADWLRDLDDLYNDGFWETEIHRALRRRGDELALTDAAAATYHGGARLATVAVERFRHARIFGALRGRRMSRAERSARVLLAPIVPILLGVRVCQTLQSRGETLRAWRSAVPPFAALATAWAVGEAWGLLAGGGRPRAERTQSAPRARRKLHEASTREQGVVS